MRHFAAAQTGLRHVIVSPVREMLSYAELATLLQHR
jgi:hypothetical protein